MRFSELFTYTIGYWPSEISIADGKDVDLESGYFKNLSNYWNIAENKTSNEGDLIEIMVWAIFCGLHKLARQEFLKGIKMIKLENIDRKYVAEKFEESMFDEENNRLQKYREKYVNDIK